MFVDSIDVEWGDGLVFQQLLFWCCVGVGVQVDNIATARKRLGLFEEIKITVFIRLTSDKQDYQNCR